MRAMVRIGGWRGRRQNRERNKGKYRKCARSRVTRNFEREKEERKREKVYETRERKRAFKLIKKCFSGGGKAKFSHMK